MPMDLLALNNTASDVVAKRAAIAAEALRASEAMESEGFTCIEAADLRRLADLYDRHFFGGWMTRRLAQVSRHPLQFDLSRRLTATGGKTTHYRRTRDKAPDPWYKITIGIDIVFQSFRDGLRDVTVGGLPCHSRLDALMRILEHELIHLAELLAWGQTSCRQDRFRQIIGRVFGHTDTTHGLVTHREHAAVRHGIRPGSLVEFDCDGQRLAGRVNRITRRATVLVPHPGGQRYTDGKTYAKYYVPVHLLRPRTQETSA